MELNINYLTIDAIKKILKNNSNKIVYVISNNNNYKARVIALRKKKNGNLILTIGLGTKLTISFEDYSNYSFVLA